MLRRRRYPSPRWVAVVVVLAAARSAFAFDDRDFCVAVSQLALAADKDIGLWIDRVTRNGGIALSCDRKLVEFKRFTYASSALLNEAWRERTSTQWSASHCGSPIWGDAIRNGWNVVLVVSSADGARIALNAQCR